MNYLVSIIVPTYNSSKNLDIFLDSFLCSKYRNFEVIVNDDIRSSDNAQDVVNKYRSNLSVVYVKENKSMAQGRKRGVDFSHGDILLFLDSDMKITEGFIEECVEMINNGYDALVIPEESYGTTFWAKCKWLEKKCYEGVDNIESLRCIKREIYIKVGGHDECMVFSEDKDLDIRVREFGVKISRIKSFLLHNEGDLFLWRTLKKKMSYSDTANVFAKKHPDQFRWQSNPFNRYIIFFKNIKYLLRYPFIYLGMIFMKTCEYLFVFVSYMKIKFEK